MIHNKQERNEKIADAILQVFAKHRKSINGQPSDIFDNSIRENLIDFIDRGQPIEIVVPAFPDKSVSRDKTLSNKPDMAEKLTFKYFKSIFNEISQIYPMGAQMRIYSDGGVFNGIRDAQYTREHRMQYLSDIRNIIREEGLERVITVLDTEGIQQILQDGGYLEPKESLQKRIDNPQNSKDRDDLELYKGQKAFWLQEVKALHPEYSDSKKQKTAKEMALGITAYSIAFSKYTDEVEPDAIRVSCHPKDFLSNKIGLKFDPAGTHATPWHNSAVKIPDLLQNRNIPKPEEYKIMNAKQGKLQYQGTIRYNKQGDPSHLEASKEASAAVAIQRGWRKRAERARLQQQLQQHNNNSIRTQ